MRVYLGSDHAGFELKSVLANWLTSAGHEVIDCGPASYHEGDDYPPYVMRAAAATAADPDSIAIVIGGSGNGEQIAANKIAGIRAALRAGITPAGRPGLSVEDGVAVAAALQLEEAVDGGHRQHAVPQPARVLAARNRGYHRPED